MHVNLVRQSEILKETPDPHNMIEFDEDQAFKPHVYQIGGNALYMYSSEGLDEQSQPILPIPTIAEFKEALDNAES